MTSPGPAELPGFDPTVPSEARVTDSFTGGKDNFAADRELAKLALEIAPELPMVFQESRKFADRAARFLVDAGVRQFIDVGCGMPTPDSLHHVLRPVAPDAKVAYVDHDPVVVAHGRALIDITGPVRFVQADARDPDRMLDHPDLTRIIDLNAPVAILLQSLLTVIPEDDVATAVVRRFIDRLPSGHGYLLVTHAVRDIRPEVTAELAQLYQEQGTVKGEHKENVRSWKEVEHFLDGLRLVPPGVVPLPDWRPDPGEPTIDTSAFWVVGGIGQKP
ncbi:SAM-dependent methyltransferase [Actinomadura craniellae]|uniref:SAM-dependent methyltransferase n=1 Tax=Actinomadura craniellae TaxID=2231787 RepID=UPI001314CA66|nr:SAM-dependent methyltransferase [Actinomadura craniellae]